jgi:hypothetical protein
MRRVLQRSTEIPLRRRILLDTGNREWKNLLTSWLLIFDIFDNSEDVLCEAGRQLLVVRVPRLVTIQAARKRTSAGEDLSSQSAVHKNATRVPGSGVNSANPTKNSRRR